MSARAALIALMGMVALVPAAEAATLYSNLNTVEPDYLGLFDATGAYVAGPESFAGQTSHVANGFSLPVAAGVTSYRLDSARVALSLVDGPNVVTVSVVTSEEGLPDTDDVLRSVTITGQLASYSAPGLIDVVFSTPLTLTPGQQYWLVAVPGEPTTAAAWHYSYVPELVWNEEWEWFDIVDHWTAGDVAWFNGSIWQRAEPTEPMPTVPPNDAMGAFELHGSPVPEPAFVTLVAGPVLSALWLRRRTR